MKSFTAILVIILTLSFCNSWSQKWNHIYGNPGTDEAFSDIIELYDKGYLIAGYFEENQGCWLIKTDLNGAILWEKFLSWDNVSIYGAFLGQDDSGNIYLASSVAGYPTGNWPIITKLDSCGNKVWCRVFKDEYFNYGWFDDVLVLDNGDILALAYLDSDEETELIFLYYIDSDGSLVWRDGYASREDYSLIRSANGDGIKKYGNNYLIHGHCYYPYPTDTTHFFQRPLFIMLDSVFNEQWIIPFGVNDSIIGKGYNTTELNDSTFFGVGTRRIGDAQNSLLMFFNKDGQELGFNQISNEVINSNIEANYIYDIERIDDTLYLASSNFGNELMGNPYGDFVIDTAGNLFNFQSRPNTHGTSKLIKTFDNKFVIGTGYYEGKTDWDIYMYKINEDLEHDTIYPGNYTYDSLCPYQIQSGEIDISNCLIVTDVKESPTPKEYYKSLNNIPVKAYPNPAKEGTINFEFQNTEHNRDMELRCFDVFGKQVHVEKIYQFQGVSKVNIDNWKTGMYVALVYSNSKVVGQTKFVVQ